MSSRKAMEHPQEVIRMLFIAIILVFNIVIVYNFMQEMDISFTWKANSLKFNSIAGRILYSPDCYALEEEYTLADGTVRKQAHAGILDIAKLQNNNRLHGCINNAQYESAITCDGKTYSEKTECKGKNYRTAKMLTLINDGTALKKGIATIKVCA